MNKFKLITNKGYNLTFTCDNSTALLLSNMARQNFNDRIICSLNTITDIPDEDLQDELARKYPMTYLMFINMLLSEYARINPYT